MSLKPPFVAGLSSIILMVMGLNSSASVAETVTLKDQNELVCAKVRAKLTGFGQQPLSRELTLLLFEASKKNCGLLVQNLVTKGAAVKARDRSASSPLMNAAGAGNLDILQYLQSVGADISHSSLRGNTALLVAVRSNRAKVVKYLLKQGVDPNTQSLDKITPLSAACFDGNTRLVNYLLDAGADATMEDGVGKAPIIYAAAKGFSNIVATLITKGVDPNKVYKSRLSALMWAAGHTSDTPASDGVETINILVENGAKLNLQDDRGRTALSYAYQLNNKAAVDVLLSLGADFNIRDNSKKLAVSYAP